MKNHVAQPAASSSAVLSGYPSVAPNIDPKNWANKLTPFRSVSSTLPIPLLIEVHTSKLAHELKRDGKDDAVKVTFFAHSKHARERAATREFQDCVFDE
jgi:hypothetical protein